tara:strand:- start:3127 stop:4251 length:1125 start_codon:yes stop_codon:yes gene_type:complete
MGTGLQLRSLIKDDNTLELSLVEVGTPQPGPDEVLVRVQAAPINPSDLALLLGPADVSTAVAGGTRERPVITATIPREMMAGVASRIGQSMAVGNEGAGEVIAAGSSAPAQALLGKTVGMFGGEMFSEYRCLKATQCLPLHTGTTAAEGASCFVNPLTALCMVETMRRENHTALVHTAAASNLGKMLNRLCQAENIELVNIVRKPAQEALLRELGAHYVLNSTTPSFDTDLTEALVATGATLAFDATGGGELASRILTSMEAAAVRNMDAYNRYGSDVYKQVYIYGVLDQQPTMLARNYGFSWGVGGWLLTNFMRTIGMQEVVKLQARVAAEIKTTFASDYAHEISLAEALSPEALNGYAARSTGNKYLINPVA